ncbi:tetratricopeptide repeat protein [Horticoccus sp. 23ND18S-11]|uniref:tetratricopeptide repeat protein n=1 Tax=Horticoccus sp. 23ND18S-11 TaxID=3391832 RepID=UPI0039C9E999
MPHESSRSAASLSGDRSDGNWFERSPGWRVVAVSAVGAALITLCFFAPRFWLWPAAGLPLTEFISIEPEFHRAFHALRQLNDPWMPIDDATNRVIEWRLFWPVLAHTLGLSKGVYLALPHLGCVVALLAVAAIVWRATLQALPTAGATLLAATSSWFFVSTGWLAYFDSWLVLALVLASFAQSRWLLFGAALIAPWIDERFIVALPLCIAVRSAGTERATPRDRTAFAWDGAALAAGIAPYIAVRLGVEWTAARGTSRAYWTDRPLVPAPWLPMLWGAWNGLRLGWVAVAFACVAAFRLGRHRLAVATALAALIVNLCIADDISRSASMAVPVMIAGVLLAWRHRPAQSRRLLPALCAANLVLPAQHVIATWAAPTTHQSMPILALDAERERARNPPEFASPSAYNRRSIDHFQNKSVERALVAADIALAFDPDFAKAIANHGILLYMSGRKPEGTLELDRALQRAPQLYDARLQRAAFRQQAGDLRGALEDVRQALQDMPADWPRRPEAQQYERTLAAQVGR